MQTSGSYNPLTNIYIGNVSKMCAESATLDRDRDR